MQAMVYIGEQLKRARLRRAMTQRELAQTAGVAPRTITELENNRNEPHPSTLRKLSVALHVDPAELLED